MGETDPVFENERYEVIIGDFEHPVVSHGGSYSRGYMVINKINQVTEVYTAQLPDAIASAEQLDIALDQQTWKWIRINSDADSLIEAGDPEVVH